MPARSFSFLLVAASLLPAAMIADAGRVFAQDAMPEQNIAPPSDAPAPSRKSRRHKAAVAAASEDAGARSELAGRYAVMREKRDTGCMVTLDATRTKGGGDRAQLAPGCRDQGIVIFDPSAWAVVKGELVLTARAGHKTRLVKAGEGAWAKDPKDGGKPLGLKKL